MSFLPLTRSASFTDYPSCASMADWQQRLAENAYDQWCGAPFIEPAGLVLCLNWGAAHFCAPGPLPHYYAYSDPDRVDEPISVLYALSVLDRVDAPRHFLRRQATRLLPGGLIVCTFAAWDATGEDCAVGHELRHRIYDQGSWGSLIQAVRGGGLLPFGGVDLRYRGHTLGDHTLASLVLMKGTTPCQ
jgi:hypothetical protein